MQLRIEFEQDADERWIAAVPTLSGVRADGADRAEARAKVQALALRVLAERLEHGEAGQGPLTVSFQAEKEYRLGVLLVHGIGTQPLGETLVRWGDVLLKTIDHATRHRVEVTVGSACRDGQGHREHRAESVVRLRAGDREEQWLLSEGWWADAFLAPSYRELVSWSVRALPWFVALYIAQRYWQAVEGRGILAWVRQAAIATAQLLAALALAPLFILLLTVGLILGLLPIPQLRTFILNAQGTLAATVGDSFAFVESPMRAALMRTRVLNGLERLKQRCERTIIIAHSQGAGVVLDAIGGIPEPVHEAGPAAAREASTPDVVPDTLVTFGAGSNHLASLKVLSKGLPSRIGPNPTFQAIGALVIAALLSVSIYADILSRRATPLGILYTFAALAVGGLVGYLWRFLSKRWLALRKKYEHTNPYLHYMLLAAASTAVLLAAFLLVVVGAAALVWRSTDLPLPAWELVSPISLAAILVDLFPAAERVWPLLMALILVAVSISTILSKETRNLVTIVRKPPGLSRWIDLFASADPVPNGPTGSAQTDMPDRSIRISNLGSFFADHTTYWDNLDGFVLRIVTECAETAESPWLAELPPVTDTADKRSAWRVGWLRLARWVVVLTWLLAGAKLWISYGKVVPLPFELPGWLPPRAETAARVALLTALIALICWASLAAVRVLWGAWVRTEQKAVLAHQKFADHGTGWLTGMCTVVYLFVILASHAFMGPWMLADLALVIEPTLFKGADAGTLFIPFIIGLAVLCGFAWFSAWLLLWLKPAPEDPKTGPADVNG